MTEYILYGNGGYARVVEDLIEYLGGHIVAIYDSENLYQPQLFPDARVIIAIGNPETRAKVASEIKHKFGTLIHPNAYVSKRAVIGQGCVILSNATVQATANIGDHVIINSNVTVDHDAILENFITTYPGVYFGGTAHVKELSRIESNTVIR